MDKFLDGISQVFSGDALVAIVAGLAVAFFVKVIPRLIAGVPFIAPRDLKKRLDAGEEAVIIDVREPDEFNDALGHIPGALNVPPSRLSERVKFLKADLAEYADIPVYLTCKSSSRAASAARTLKGAGLRKIHVVTGGMLKWNRQGAARDTRLSRAYLARDDGLSSWFQQRAEGLIQGPVVPSSVIEETGAS